MGLPSIVPHSPQRWASGRSCRPWQTWSGSTSHRRCSPPRRRTWCSAAASDSWCRQSAPGARTDPWLSHTDPWGRREEEGKRGDKGEREGSVQGSCTGRPLRKCPRATCIHVHLYQKCLRLLVADASSFQYCAMLYNILSATIASESKLAILN